MWPSFWACLTGKPRPRSSRKRAHGSPKIDHMQPCERYASTHSILSSLRRIHWLHTTHQVPAWITEMNIFDARIHIRYWKRCINMKFNWNSVDPKYTIFLVLVVALVVDYSFELKKRLLNFKILNASGFGMHFQAKARASSQQLPASL